MLRRFYNEEESYLEKETPSNLQLFTNWNKQLRAKSSSQQASIERLSKSLEEKDKELELVKQENNKLILEIEALKQPKEEKPNEQIKVLTEEIEKLKAELKESGRDSVISLESKEKIEKEFKNFLVDECFGSRHALRSKELAFLLELYEEKKATIARKIKSKPTSDDDSNDEPEDIIDFEPETWFTNRFR